MTRKQIIKHYKAHFGIQDVPFKNLGSSDKLMIEWAEELVKNCSIPDVVNQRKLLVDFLNWFEGYCDLDVTPNEKDIDLFLSN